MILEIDVHEVGALLVGEMALHDEEATLERLGARLADRGEHVSLILPPKCADVDLAAVAEMLVGGVVDRLGHWVPWVSRRLRSPLAYPMKAGPAGGRLIWIKTIA